MGQKRRRDGRKMRKVEQIERRLRRRSMTLERKFGNRA